jgi:hypothetical protein
MVLTDKEKAEQAIAAAKEHVNDPRSMQTSAALCLNDSERLYAAGAYPQAQKRAVDSLSYSVGIFHDHYKRAKA